MKITCKPMLTIYIVMLFLSSCNNEELFYVQTDELIVEDVPIVDNPNPEDVLTVLLGDDSYTTLQGVPVVMAPYTNDENIPSAFIFNATSPVSGTVTIDDNATPTNFLDDIITYTPNSGFFGTDTFEYSVCDATNSQNCDTAIVTIIINPIQEDIAIELKAFPTAKGAGAYATGGRGQSVYHVTNLNDSGAGSLRDALSAGNRTIVFDVAGIINSTGISVDVDNVTIAGQTAPDGGITITGETTYFKGDNNIIRYIRFRGGSTNKDAFNGYYMTNTIIDHCSFSFGEDEAGSFLTDTSIPTTEFTIQNSFFAESHTGTLLGSGSGFYDFVGNLSSIQNFYYNLTHRFPNLGGDGRFDVINNVAWNMTKRGVRGNGDFDLNHIGNYLDYGTPIHDEILNHYSYADGDTPQIYSVNNKIVSQRGVRIGTGYTMTNSVEAMNADNFLSWHWFQDGTEVGIYGIVNRATPLTTDFKATSQFPLLGSAFTPLTGDEAFANVPTNAGANARLGADGSKILNRDTLETEWLSEVAANNHTLYIAESAYSTSTPFFTGGMPYTDSDNDGMPDVWEVANGFNPNLNDGAGDADSDGYTNLEEFLNMVDN